MPGTILPVESTRRYVDAIRVAYPRFESILRLTPRDEVEVSAGGDVSWWAWQEGTDLDGVATLGESWFVPPFFLVSQKESSELAMILPDYGVDPDDHQVIGYDDAGDVLLASSADGAIADLSPGSDGLEFVAPSVDFLVRAVTRCWQKAGWRCMQMGQSIYRCPSTSTAWRRSFPIRACGTRSPACDPKVCGDAEVGVIRPSGTGPFALDVPLL